MFASLQIFCKNFFREKGTNRRKNKKLL